MLQTELRQGENSSNSQWAKIGSRDNLFQDVTPSKEKERMKEVTPGGLCWVSRPDASNSRGKERGRQEVP